ncbi:MAG TPA: hypothetical protein VN894_10735 [Polyangiaceae bacterium]|nr:hypothetical protein [Polyangiaceae bacterium]
MEQKGHEEARSPRERLVRTRTLACRGLNYWKGSLLMFSLAGAVAVAGAWRVKHVYRSECTVLAKARIRTDDRDDSSTSPDQVARQSARLKDMLTTRARLESAIKRFGLYGDTVAQKTMLDAVEQMKPHVGFRALEGAQYVISFDGDDPDVVQKVTQYLSESLTLEYAAGDLDDLQREADFLTQEEVRSLAGLEESTKAVTLFLAAHPEFAVEAKQAASTPFGPSPVAGIPLMPKSSNDAATANDPELSALYRERARLAGEARSAAAMARGVVAGTASSKQLDDQIAQAQAEVEVAAKRVAETLGDLASKSNLTEDHPDMRAARMAADAGARQLHGTKGKLAALLRLKDSALGGAMPDASQVPPEIAEKLRQVDLQITMRRARASHGRPPSGAEGPEPPSTSAGRAVTAVVELETDWQRLLRALSESKSHHDDLNLRVERVKLALEATRALASERMAVVDPPFRPTHPVKGGRTNVAIAGLAMACLLAIAYATARVSLDDTLVDADDLEALGLAPVLGVVPSHHPVSSPKKVHAHAAA